MYIRKLTTNCKGITRSYEFSPTTIINGANASGKSGTVAAIELALTGRIDGIGERGSEVLKLGDDSGLFARAELSNGDKCTYDIEHGSGRHWSGKRGSVRSRFVNELISLGSKKAKETLLSYANQSVDFITTNNPLWNKLWTGDITTMPGAIRSRKLALNKVLSSVNELSPTSNEADELKKNIAKAEAANKCAEIRREIETILPKVTKSYSAYATYGQVTEVQKANKSFAHCLACGASQKHWNKERVESIEYSEVGMWKRLSGLREGIQTIEDRFNGSILLEVPQDILKRMKTRLGEIEQTKPYVHITEEEVKYIRQEYEELKLLEKKAEEIVTVHLASFIKEIEHTVEKLTGETFTVRLEPFEFGYVRNGQFRPFEVLSGAERAICASALACALDNKDDPSVVIVDDVWLDENSSLKLLNVLKNATDLGLISQAFVTMVDANVVEPGWTVVNA